MEHHPIEKIEEEIEKVEEKVEELAVEAERGESARTPGIVLGGLTLILAAVVAVVLAIVFTVYLLA
jgi:hypothetical protein